MYEFKGRLLLLQGKENNSLSIPAHKCTRLLACTHILTMHGIRIALLLLQGKENNSLSMPAHKCMSLLACTRTRTMGIALLLQQAKENNSLSMTTHKCTSYFHVLVRVLRYPYSFLPAARKRKQLMVYAGSQIYYETKLLLGGFTTERIYLGENIPT